MNATHRDNTSHVVDSIDFGRGGIAFGQGTYQDYKAVLTICANTTNNILSSAEKAEFFAGGDVTQHNYYTAARDFVPNVGFFNVVGEKGNVTGTLVNGTADDFVERT